MNEGFLTVPNGGDVACDPFGRFETCWLPPPTPHYLEAQVPVQSANSTRTRTGPPATLSPAGVHPIHPVEVSCMVGNGFRTLGYPRDTST
jgi:hypothetical protein